MRIASWLPGTTELLFDLGVGDQLVARAEECVWPAAVACVPVMARRPPGNDPGAEREAGLRPERTAEESHRHLVRYEVDLQALALARPEIILTQEVCPVCAGAYELAGDAAAGVRVAGATLEARHIRLVSLAPRRLEEVLGQITTVAQLVEQSERGTSLLKTRGARLLALRMHVARYLTRSGASRPRVAFMEWVTTPVAAAAAQARGVRDRIELLDLPGLWVPDMIDAAGGLPQLIEAGAEAAQVTPQAVLAAQPDVLLIGSRETDLATAAGRVAAQIVHLGWEQLPAVQTGRTWVLALDPLFAHAGPRLVEGVEVLVRVVFPQALGANGVPPDPTEAVRLPAKDGGSRTQRWTPA